MLLVVRDDDLQLGEEEEDVADTCHGLVQEVDGGNEPVAFVAEAHLAQVAKSAHFSASKEFLRLDQGPAREKRQQRVNSDHKKRQLLPT